MERGRGKEVMESSSLWASGRYFEFPFNLKYKDAVPAALPWSSQPSQSNPSLSKRPRDSCALDSSDRTFDAPVPPLASLLIIDVGRIRELVSQKNSLRRKPSGLAPPEIATPRSCLPSLRMHFREKRAICGMLWNIETRYFWETMARRPRTYFLKCRSARRCVPRKERCVRSCAIKFLIRPRSCLPSIRKRSLE